MEGQQKSSGVSRSQSKRDMSKSDAKSKDKSEGSKRGGLKGKIKAKSVLKGIETGTLKRRQTGGVIGTSNPSGGGAPGSSRSWQSALAGKKTSCILVIHNRSSYTFTLTNDKLAHGKWAKKVPATILPDTTADFGVYGSKGISGACAFSVKGIKCKGFIFRFMVPKHGNAQVTCTFPNKPFKVSKKAKLDVPNAVAQFRIMDNPAFAPNDLEEPPKAEETAEDVAPMELPDPESSSSSDDNASASRSVNDPPSGRRRASKNQLDSAASSKDEKRDHDKKKKEKRERGKDKKDKRDKKERKENDKGHAGGPPPTLPKDVTAESKGEDEFDPFGAPAAAAVDSPSASRASLFEPSSVDSEWDMSSDDEPAQSKIMVRIGETSSENVHKSNNGAEEDVFFPAFGAPPTDQGSLAHIPPLASPTAVAAADPPSHAAVDPSIASMGAADIMGRVSEALEVGELAQAQSLLDAAVEALKRQDAPAVHFQVCDAYRALLEALPKLKRMKDDAEKAALSQHLTTLLLAPKHRTIAMRMSIKYAMRAGNYGDAGQHLQTLLAKPVPDKTHLAKLLDTCANETYRNTSTTTMDAIFV